MDPVEIYGAVAVSAMVLCYSLEERGTGYVLAFAIACVASASYGALIRSWPFAAVELVWAAIALRRWQSASPRSLSRGAPPRLQSLRARAAGSASPRRRRGGSGR